ncbi:MAG TPA: glycosyltransferase family 4 protein [Pirellulales bacterium]|nr:glycosyltransferase family 4 protein [Pirellulales bacterium]
MRILLANQRPFRGAERGLPFAELDSALAAAGHQVRRLAVGSPDSEVQLSDQELTAYRDVLRQALDAEIDAFDPHIVHAQPIGILAHLALEAGVAYLLTASGMELPVDRLDPRLQRFTVQAAENASRIVAVSDAVRAAMIAAFGDLDGRIITMAPALAAPELAFTAETQAEAALWLTQLYRQVLTDRFGFCPEG